MGTKKSKLTEVAKSIKLRTPKSKLRPKKEDHQENVHVKKKSLFDDNKNYNIKDWVESINNTLMPLFFNVKKIRSFDNETAKRMFIILANLLLVELNERDNYREGFALLGVEDEILKKFKNRLDAKNVSKKRNAIRQNFIKKRSNSTIYREACYRAMLIAVYSHANGRSEVTVSNLKRNLPEQKYVFGKSENEEVWKVWLRNYLTQLHQTGELKLPKGTVFASHGKQDDRLKDRNAFIKKFLKTDVFDISLNIALQLVGDSSPLVSFKASNGLSQFEVSQEWAMPSEG